MLAIGLAIVACLTAGGMAVRTVSRIWLRHWVERRLAGSAAAELYLERPHRLLLAAGTGVTLTVFAMGVMLAVRASADTTRLVADVVIVAILALVLGQIVPRAIARRFAPQVVALLVPVLRAVDLLLRPIVGIAAAIARRLSPSTRRLEDERDDLGDLLREGELEGVGEHDEIAIITGVVEFGEKRAREIMTPRDDVFALDISLPPPVIARRIAVSAYSRVPIYKDTLDNVLGMLHAFDVLKADDESLPPLRKVHEALDTAPCNELLFSMLRARRHLAVVRDASGTLLGIVTLEDLLEELVGDIRDEHDEPAPRAAEPAKSSSVDASSSSKT
jgi:putative hemolysin